MYFGFFLASSCMSFFYLMGAAVSAFLFEPCCVAHYLTHFIVD